MTNPTLSEFKFNELLPLSVKDMPKFKAASECLDTLFAGFDERVKQMLVYSRIDELNNDQLDDLAWQWNVGYFEGYNFAETLDDKRALVKHAIQLHWFKGTPWALKSVPEFLGMPTFVIEWFDADLIGAEMLPYEFDFAIDTGVRGASATIYEDILTLINNLKNVRSYLRHIILMISWRVTAYYAAQGQGVNINKVRPMWWPGSTAELKYGRAVGGYSAATGYLRPWIWPEKTAEFGYHRAAIGHSVEAGRVLPDISAIRVDLGAILARTAGNYGAAKTRVKPQAWAAKTARLRYSRAAVGHSVEGGRVLPTIKTISASFYIAFARTVGYYAATVGRVNPKPSNGAVTVDVPSRSSGYGATVGRVNPAIYDIA